MHKLPEAIAAYAKATELDAKNVKAHFALADLYILTNAAPKATELYRKIIRNSTDDEVVRRAGRAAIDLEEMMPTLGELERVLSPLTFVMSHKPVYRQLLVDLLVRYVPTLAERARSGAPDVAAAATAELQRLGTTGLRPLLEALRDDKDQTEQRLAIGVLGYLQNRDAALPLLRIATAPVAIDTTLRASPAAQVMERELRVAAVIAAGRLADPNAVADLVTLADHERPEMRQAALFAMARAHSAAAVPTLIKHLDDQDADSQALACLGLVDTTDGKVIAQIAAVAADRSRADVVRGACAYALATTRAPGNEAVLTDLVVSGTEQTQRLAAWGLASLGSPRSIPTLLNAYFTRGSDAGQVAADITAALGQLAIPMARSTNHTFAAPPQQNRIDVNGILETLPNERAATTLRADWLANNATAVADAINRALQLHRDVVLGTLTDLDHHSRGLSLGTLLSNDELQRPSAVAALGNIARTIEPTLRTVAANADSKVRASALSVLGKIGTGSESAAILLRGLTDPAESVVIAAINASGHWLQREPNPELRAHLHALTAAPSWQVRPAAVSAAASCGALTDSELAVLAKDASAFVRQAVATSIGLSTTAWPVLDGLAKDPIWQVRAAVAGRLRDAVDGHGKALRATLATDRAPQVRLAAGEKQ